MLIVWRKVVQDVNSVVLERWFPRHQPPKVGQYRLGLSHFQRSKSISRGVSKIPFFPRIFRKNVLGESDIIRESSLHDSPSEYLSH